MSLTRIGSIGINTGIAFAGVTTIVTLNTANDALSIGATVNVGSGITLGASGDIFATGVSTVTTLKVGSGVTVSSDGDIFATGVCTATSFSGSGANLTGIDTDLVSDTSPQLGGNLDVNTKNIVFGDSGSASDDRLTFGAGTDLSIYHNGTNSVIADTGSGNLSLQSNGADINIWNSADGEYMGKFATGGSVELYHDGTKKFETASYGVSTDGLLNFNGTGDKILIADDGKISFGGGGDLDIYHSGGANYCDIASGQQLYFRVAGSNKFYVQSGGAQFVGSLYGDDSNKIELGNNQDLQIYHDGSHSYVSDTSTGNLKITSNGTAVQIEKSDGENMAVFRTDGAVELYHDNSKKVETNSTGINMVDKVIMFQGQGSRVIKYRDGENDMIYEGAAGFFMRQNIGDSRHEFFVGNNKKVSVTDTGITFGNDTAAANALDDYEEGTYTPTDDSGAGLSFTINTTATYTKIGRMMYVQFDITWPSTSNSAVAAFTMPTGLGLTVSYGTGVIGWTDNGKPLFIHVGGKIYVMDNNNSIGNASQHTLNSEISGKRLIGSVWYIS